MLLELSFITLYLSNRTYESTFCFAVSRTFITTKFSTNRYTFNPTIATANHSAYSKSYESTNHTTKHFETNKVTINFTEPSSELRTISTSYTLSNASTKQISYYGAHSEAFESTIFCTF